MPCNCGGAAPQAPQTSAPAVRLPGRPVGAVRADAPAPAATDRRTGGPGDAAYYWNGPARPKR